MGIKLNFKIDDDYLIAHILLSMGDDRFSSTKHKKEIVAFQNYAWKKCRPCYNLLVGRPSATEVVRGGLQNTTEQMPKFLNELENSKQYQKIRQQTEEYLKFSKSKWNENYLVSSAVIKDLTGLKFNKEFTVYITHPSLKNGSYMGDNTIAWGHNEDWPNYATVYLWHEILHSYLGYSEKEHALVELIADEELRIQLNGGKYPPFVVGHKNLEKIKKKLLPQWRKYLKSENRNIREFLRRIT